MMWLSSLTFTTLVLMLAFSEVRSGQSAVNWDQEEENPLRNAKAMRQDLDTEVLPKESRAAWTLDAPELSIVRNKVKVTLQGPSNLKNVWFYMSVNSEFSRLKDAEFKLKLKCNKNKLCKKRGGPILGPGDVVHYGMAAKINGVNGRMTFLGLTWIPIPVTTEPPTGTPANNNTSCGLLGSEIPSGCVQNTYPEPTGFPSTGNGRRNPERGFYKYTEAIASNWNPLESSLLDQFVNDGYTLIYRIIVLDTFVNTDISDSILQNIRDDFETMRTAGIKVILRFCYSINQEVIDDAPPLQLSTHIDQLAPILQENVDVIAVLQTGFIGVWGEWYYTANYGNEGNITPEDYEKRRQVVFHILDVLPTSRQIELRTPNYKRVILERTSPVTPEEAHTEARVARIGHHNDCFLASDTDFGTYMDKDEEYPYLQSETMYVVQGGETCNPNSPRSDCPTALTELSELHYTYLNTDYHPDVLQSWRDQGCFDEVDSSLGYRLVALLSQIPEEVAVGTSSEVGMRIQNMGWSSPVNYRSAQLVIRHTDTEEEYISPLESGIDLRDWLPGDHDIVLTLTVPSSASTGLYEVLLRLPDGEVSLEDNPDFNILLENATDGEDSDSRLNLLGTTTVV